jgi:GNAT superfamily N-acetyltransferase
VPADVPVIHEIVERAFEPYIARIGRRPAPMDDDYGEKVRHGTVFVWHDAEVVGVIVLNQVTGHVLVETVAVRPDHQSHGIARGLFEFAEEYARARGLYELRLYTNAAMTENLALYPHLGYAEDDRRVERGFERVFFSKRIDRPKGAKTPGPQRPSE